MTGRAHWKERKKDNRMKCTGTRREQVWLCVFYPLFCSQHPPLFRHSAWIAVLVFCSFPIQRPPFAHSRPDPTATQSNLSSYTPLWTTSQLDRDECCPWCIVVTTTLLCWSGDFDPLNAGAKHRATTLQCGPASLGTTMQMRSIQMGLTATPPQRPGVKLIRRGNHCITPTPAL